MQEKPLQSSPNLHEPSVIKCLPVGMPLALLFCMSLLAATLIAPTARGFADDDDRKDTRNQRQDLRQDQQQLE
jgi:ABC-type transport system involved in cytochrome bd biosynthesis fused ATPase/permease subunit